MMTLYRNDLITLMGPYVSLDGPYTPIIGTTRARSSNGGSETRDIIVLEVTILNGHRQRMTAWTRVPCGLKNGGWTPNAVPRLDGPVLRDLLYAGSAPDLQRLLILATQKRSLVAALPNLNIANNPPNPPFFRYTGTVKFAPKGVKSRDAKAANPS
jgi:hypothetical protein